MSYVFYICLRAAVTPRAYLLRRSSRPSARRCGRPHEGHDAVRDDESRRALTAGLQCLANARVGLRVDGRKRVVENKNITVLIRARAIATRCFCPPERVIPRSPTMVSYPFSNLWMSSCMAAMRAASYAFRIRFFHLDRYVLKYGLRVKEGFLQYYPDPASQVRLFDLRNLTPADGDVAAFVVIKPLKEVYKSRFSGPRTPEDRNRLAAFHGHVETFEHLMPFIIEPDVPKDDVLPDIRFQPVRRLVFLLLQ